MSNADYTLSLTCRHAEYLLQNGVDFTKQIIFK